MKRALAVLGVLVYSSLVMAATVPEAVQHGFSYLQAQQNADGSWGHVPEDVPLTTGTVLQAYLAQDYSDNAFQSGLLWLQYAPAGSTQAKALKAGVLCRAVPDVEGSLEDLLSFNNEDPGFGGRLVYASDTPDTIAALAAFQCREEQYLPIMAELVQKLSGSQNMDGSWGFVSAAPGSPFYSADALSALSRSLRFPLEETKRQAALNYLALFRQPNGSYGDILTTAGVFETLSLSHVSVNDTLQYLLNAQQFDGSWEGNPYITARVLKALAQYLPNLSLDPIVTLDPQLPVTGDMLSMTVRVINDGYVSLDGAVVGVYDRLDAHQLHLLTLPAIPAGGSVDAVFSLDLAGISGSWGVEIRLDPEDQVRENDETDNAVSQAIYVQTRPDLTLFSGDIRTIPTYPEPNQPFTLQIRFRNLGDAQTAPARYSIQRGENSVFLPLSEGDLPLLGGHTSASVETILTLSEGYHLLRVTLDSSGIVEEGNEDNNVLNTTLTVAQNTQQDFAIVPNSVTVTGTPEPGNTVVFGADVLLDAQSGMDVPVAFYDGVPGRGGLLISQHPIYLEPGGAMHFEAAISLTANSYVLYIVVDPSNVIPETNELNNRAFRLLRIDLADLVVSSDGVSVSPESPGPGETVQVRMTVKNVSNFDTGSFAIQVEEAGQELHTAQSAGIAAGMRQTFTFSTTATQGTHVYSFTADVENAVPELAEENNSVTLTYSTIAISGADLVITALDASQVGHTSQMPIVNGPVILTVRNDGDQPSEACKAAVFEDRNGNRLWDADEILLGEGYIPALEPAAPAVITLSLEGSLPFYHALVYAFIDSENTIAEQSESNNLRHLFLECPDVPSSGFPPPQVLWQNATVRGMGNPVVIHLTDDNGDGRMDEHDIPAIVLHLEENGDNKLKALRGTDGQTIWELSYNAEIPIGQPPYHEAAGDVDGDGLPEIVIPLDNGRVACISHDGNVQWISVALEFGGGDYAGAPILANLDGYDGIEILIGRTVLSGQTGAVLAIGTKDRGQNTNPQTYPYLPDGYPFTQELPTVADLDGDSYPEIIAGNTAYRLVRNAGLYTMEVVWSWDQMIGTDEAYWDANATPDGFSAVGNLDADAYPEIAFVSAGQIFTMDHTGHILHGPVSVGPNSPWGGSPLIADLDGDGQVEIVVAGEVSLTAFNTTLSSWKWRRTITEAGGMTGVSAADLDGDGILEVLYRDQGKLYIFRGSDGVELFSVNSGSGTATEYPVPVDVTGDGILEVIMTSPVAGNYNGVTVWGNPRWARGSSIWNQYDYHTTNVDADATIPYPEYPQWQLYNKTRTSISRASDYVPQANLTASLLRMTQELGRTTLLVRLGNGGETYLPPGVNVALFADDNTAEVRQTPESLSPGSYIDLEFVFSQPGLHHLQVRADNNGNGTGSIIECDELDNLTSSLDTFNSSTDLLISAADIQFSPQIAVAGVEVMVTIGVTNAGTQVVENALVRVSAIHQGVTAVLDERTLTIQPGTISTFSFAWTAQAGFTLFQVVADPANTLPEYSETNNSAVKGITIEETSSRANLALSLIETPTLDEDAVSGILTGQVKVLVRNTSANPLERSTDLLIFEDLNGSGRWDAGDGRQLRQTIVPALMSFESIEQTITLNVQLSYPGVRLAAQADAQGLIDEESETDNFVLLRAFCKISVNTAPMIFAEEWTKPYTTYSVPVVFDFVKDAAHTPDLIFIQVDSILCVRGDTGALNWTFHDPSNVPQSHGVHPAFGDLNGDGKMEIVFPRKNTEDPTDGRGHGLFAINEEGVLVWSNPAYLFYGDRGGAAIANLDGKDYPEVVFGAAVFDGLSGIQLWANESFGHGANVGIDRPRYGYLSIVADINRDGAPDLIAGNTAFTLTNINGTWAHTILWNRSDLPDGFPAVGDFDADGKGEVVLVTSGRVYLLDDDGGTLWGPVYLDGLGGPPTIGDADRDGRPDIAVAAAGHIYLIKANGHILWSRETNDASSQTTGVTFYDFEGDGTTEVIYNDEDFIRVYDGSTGAERYKSANKSATMTEYPIIADVDGDGEAEVVALAPTSAKIRVLGSPSRRWIGTRPLWSQHSYHITNIRDDGQIPLVEQPSWSAQNTYRSNTITYYGESDVPNAVLGSITIDQESGPNRAIITFIVANASLEPLASLPWALYNGNPATTGVLIASGTETNLAAGQYRQVTAIWSSPSNGNKTLYFLLDPADEIIECNESDNSRSVSVYIDVPPPEAPDLIPSPLTRFGTGNIHYAGQPFEIHAIIANQGGYSTGPFSVAVFDGNPATVGIRLATLAIPGMAGLETQSHLITIAGGLTAGWHSLYLVVDVDKQVVEKLETNNTLMNAVLFQSPPNQPDLIVERIVSQTITEADNSLAISGSVECVIANASPVPVVGEFSVAILPAFTGSDGAIVGRFRFIRSLGSYERGVVTVPIEGVLPFRGALLVVQVDHFDEVGEEKEDNNRLALTNCRKNPEYGFDPVQEWKSSVSTYSVPLVGDFVADGAGIPDIIMASSGDRIYCLRGDSGEINWMFDSGSDTTYKVASYGAHGAYGDIDKDGKLEVVFPRYKGGLFALNAENGTRCWTSSLPSYDGSDTYYGYRGGPSIADLDGDGTLEVIFRAAIISHDGANCWSVETGPQGMNAGAASPGHFSAVADLNLDGQPEIIAGPAVYTPRKDGAGNWVFEAAAFWTYSGLTDGFPAVGNFDGDPYGEVVIVTLGSVYLLDHDGRTMWSAAVTGDGGPPTIGDADGDGWPEIGVAGYNTYSLFEGNGVLKWKAATRDASSHTTASSIFDFDGDGRAEILYNDENTYWVFDGTTGLSRLEMASDSATMTEYPIVADLDGDGETEILVVSPANNDGTKKIRAYGDSLHRWVGTRKLWNQHTYHVTNINDDGTIPLIEKPSWLEHNTYRCNLPTSGKSPLAQANLTAGFLRVDNTLVPDYAKFTARVGNAGEETAKAPFIIALYRGDPAAGGVLLGNVTQAADLAPGEYVDVSVFWPQPTLGVVDVWVVADETGLINECNEEDNFHHALLTVALDIPVEYPDLFVDPATTAVLPAEPVTGQPVTLAVTVSNIGVIASPDTEVKVLLASVGGPQLLETFQVPALAVGQSWPLTLAWDTLWTLPGTYTIEFIIDPADAIQESAEGNNSATLFVTLSAPVKSDLEITNADLSFSALAPIQGDPVTLTVTMLNRGSEAVAPELRVTAAGNPILEIAYSGVLAQGQSAPFTVPLDTLDWTGPVTLNASADPNGLIEEQREDNNVGQAVLAVVPSGVTLNIDAEREQYNAQEEVLLTLTVTGTAGQDRSGEVRTVLLDEAGAVIVEFNPEPVSLAGDTPVTFTRIWNTGTQPPQIYSVRAIYYEEETGRARGTDAFTLLPSIALTAGITTNQPTYGAQTDVIIEAHYTNTGLNAALENLSGVLQVVAPGGAIVYEIPIGNPYLPPGGVAVFNAIWNTAAYPAGAYEARTTLAEPTGVITASAAVAFEVRPSDDGQGLGGDLSCQPVILDRGDTVTWNYQITNLGNTPFTDLPVQVRFYLDAATEPSLVWNRTHTLPVGSSAPASEVVPTATMVPGTYTATLVAILPSGEKLLDSSGFVLRDRLILECGLTIQPLTVSALETLALILSVHNNAYALPYENGALRLTITGPGYTFTETLALPAIAGGATHTIDYPWNAAQNPPGAYTVQAEWLDATATILCAQSAPFTVTSTADTGAGLTGDLAFDPASLERGDPLAMAYAVTNGGNAALSGLPVEVRLFLDGGATPVRAWHNTHGLPIDVSASFSDALVTRPMTAGTYSADLVAILPGGEIRLDTAGFILHDRLFLACAATATDTALSAYEDLQASITVTLDADSMSDENGALVLTITGSAYTFTEILAVPSLAAGASHTFPYSWNAAQHAPGDYTLTAEFKDGAGTVRCISTLAFTIVSTSEDGVGLSGTLTLDPTQVVQGESLFTTASCINDGNTDLLELRLKITITDSTDQVIETREYPLPLAIGQADQAIDDWSTASYPPGTYLAVLTAEVAGRSFPLDQQSFEVLSGGGFSVAIEGGNRPNILIWAVCAAKGCTDPNPYFLYTTLTNAAIPYTVVYDEAAFKTQYRTGAYTAVVLYRPDPKVLETYEELAAGVYAGTGLFLIQDHPDENPKLREACGVHVQGKHKTGGYTIQVTDSPVSAASSLALNGIFINLTLEGATAFGTIADGGTTYPVLTQHAYGAGIAVMAAFNTESLPIPAMADLYLSILRTIGSRTQAAPYAVLPVRITVTNTGSQEETITLQLTLPAGTQLLYPNPQPQTPDPCCTWSLTIPADGTLTVEFLWRLGGEAGDYTLLADLYREGAAQPEASDSFTVTVAVPADAYASCLLDEIALLLSQAQNTADLDTLVGIQNKVQSTIGRDDHERNIKDLTQAFKMAGTLSTVDPTLLKSLLAEAIKLEGVLWAGGGQ